MIYYQRGTAEEVTVSHYFDFLPSCKGWQFTGGSFSTVYVPEDDDYSDYSCVKAIDIYCEYSNQAQGYALFDNISLVNSTGTDVEKYYYYSSGTSDGLLAYKENLFYTEYYEYDANRNLSRVANNRGEITDYYYDAKNRVVRIITSDFTYNSHTDYPFFASNPDSVITRNPKTSTDFSYNNYGLLTAENTYKVDNTESRDPSVTEFFTTYNYNVTAGSKIFGSLKSETSGIGVMTQYFYDETDGKLLASVNNEVENGICYRYDEAGNLIAVLPAYYETQTSYGEITNAENVSYAYNSNNLLSTITTESTVYSFTYDKFGNPTSVKAGDNSVASYTYNDRNGKLKKVTYGNGFSVEYVYCDIELLKEIWYNYSDGTRELAYEYEYTADGQVYKFTDNANSRTAIYKYDSNKRLVGFAEYDNGDFYHDFSANVFYNDKGELSSVYYKLNNLSGEAISAGEYFYFYKGDGRLSSAQIDTDTTRGDEEYSYDHYNRVSSITTSHALRSNISSTFDTKVDYTFTEDGLYRTSSWVEDYVSTVNGTAITYTHTYDNNGNITKIVYSTGKEIRYVYDDLGQLIREDNGLLSKTYVYTYDNAGNITSKKTYALTAAGASLGTPTSTKNYGYSTSDWGDMLTSYAGTAITYDAIGNPLSYYNGSSYSFAWTGRQLSSASKGGYTYNFTYNDAGIRTSKTKNGVTTTYYLNGSQIMAEETNGNITVYIYDASGTPIGMQYHGANYSANTWDTYWYEKNLFGDIVAIYNHSGTKLVSYVYDAWGNFTTTYHNGTASTSVVAKNPFTYRGYYYDADLGLYYLQTRYYDSNTGRFINADGVGYLGANGDINSYNLFAYCSNNPIMYRDPTGHFIITALVVGALAGAAIGGTVGGVVAYNSAKESGANGSDLFWETVKGVGKGALVGGVAGGLIGASAGAVATYGISSVAATATITTTAGVAARATEVAILQTRKSRNDGDSGWQVLDDVISSSFNNMGRILSPIGTKAVTTANKYIGYNKRNSISFKKYLHTPGGKIVAYAFAFYAWYQTHQTIESSNPIQRAYERGYSIR